MNIGHCFSNKCSKIPTFCSSRSMFFSVTRSMVADFMSVYVCLLGSDFFVEMPRN